jgi:hypothetical protein
MTSPGPQLSTLNLAFARLLAFSCNQLYELASRRDPIQHLLRRIRRYREKSLHDD